MRIGIIGSGKIAKEHIKVIKDLPFNCSIAVYTRNINNTLSKSGEFFNKHNNISLYDNYKVFVSDFSPDCVFICAPPELNYGFAEKIIGDKIDLFIEKPVAFSSDDIYKLHNSCERYNLKSMVGLNRRFGSVLNDSLNVIYKHGDLLGLTLDAPEPIHLYKNYQKEILSKWIFAQTIHAFDVIKYIGGEIKDVFAFVKNPETVDKRVYNGIIEFKNGLTCNYISSWSEPYNYSNKNEWEVKLYGEKVFIRLIGIEKGSINFGGDKNLEIKPSILDIKYKSGFYKQDYYFLNSIENNERIETPASNLLDNYLTVKMIERIAVNK